MKKIATLAVISLSMMASAVHAGSCTSSALKADALTSAPDLIISNVPTCDGSTFVSGFQIIGGGGVEWYADAQHEGMCFNMDVTFLPEGVSAYDMDAVLDFLGDRKVDVFRRTETMTCA